MNHITIPAQPPLPDDRLRIPEHLRPVGTPQPVQDTRRARADARLIRAAQDLALEKAKLRLAIQQVDDRRAERETTKTEAFHA